MTDSEITIPTFKFAIRKNLETNENSDQFLPTRSDPEATGWDVRCAEPNGVLLRPSEYAKIRLGFRTFPPKGWWFELKPRSSTHAKKHLHCLYGTIDETFDLELLFSCQYLPENPSILTNPIEIEYGEKIGQIIPVKRQEMNVQRVTNEEFDKLCLYRNAQRKGGFGSTGDK